LYESKAKAGEVFDDIYRINYWGSGESRSGVGSEEKFVQRYRDRLAKIIFENPYAVSLMHHVAI
jgi:hypothetical protein